MENQATRNGGLSFLRGRRREFIIIRKVHVNIFIFSGVVGGNGGSNWWVIVGRQVIFIIRVKGECGDARKMRDLGVRG